MTKIRFEKSFTQQEGIPEEGIQLAIKLMRSGRLHRYNLEANEESQASLLEKEFSLWQGVKYCVACASGGYAIQLALRTCGVKLGDKVLANAYTLAPVPGAIHNVGAHPIFVEIDDNYHIDLFDLEKKATSSKAKFLLLSHMRGHIANMDKVTEICQKNKLTMIEDCAHTMGSKWNGIRSGNFGKVSAFSTQTYKHINSGEGGFLTTNDAELAAKAVVSSGSYMLYERHGAIPSDKVFRNIRLEAPNYSGRMDQMRASILRSQLPKLEKNIKRWNILYDTLSEKLCKIDGITIPNRNEKESYVGSSIQFKVTNLDNESIPKFVKSCLSRGVDLKWFGDKEPKAFTSRYDSWTYIKNVPVLAKTLSVLEKTIDMRIPLTFSKEDCAIIAKIIGSEISQYNLNSSSR